MRSGKNGRPARGASLGCARARRWCIVFIAMGSISEWVDLCEKVREHPHPELSPAWKGLYQLASSLGVAVLRSRRGYSRNDAMEIVHDVLTKCWRSVVHADNPKAFFTTVLMRHATTKWRKKDNQNTPTEPEQLARLIDLHAQSDVAIGAARFDLAIVVEWIVSNCSERDARVLLHTLNGESAAEVAEREQLSIDNVHQIVHRTKKAIGEAFRESP